MNDNIVDITLDNAQSLLIEESFKRPVLIDFWADWCAPCKTLMPILEKLATEYNGQFLLAKVNADEHQMIAGQFGVRSLPTIMVMKDGQPVDGFTGAQPEQKIREILDKYLPKPWDLQAAQAQELIQAENFTEALPILSEAYQSSSQQASIGFLLVECFIALKRFDEAKAILDNVKMKDQDAMYEQLKAKLELAQEAQKSPEITALEKQLDAAPEDFQLMLQLAVQYNQQGYQKDALALLYSIIQKDMQFADGVARKTYTDILAAMGKGDPVAVAFQRKLYTLLY